MVGYPKHKVGEKAKRPHQGLPLLAEDIAHLLRYYHGNVSRVADKLGTDRSSIRKFIDRNPQLGEVLKETRERTIDSLEECSWHKALQGDTSMIMFLLKTIGRDRGYDIMEKNQSLDVAKAAFEFIKNQSKNPVEIDNKPSTMMLEHDTDHDIASLPE